ncbi:MAG TPA: 16S rRNA (guanine(527)-N(7))-methyltransferase RsmG, partial [Clostridiales bacterium UBA8960]|nr:16S rRNA (guanine(527)-N(7))-methyltransferase RsmG [Clostridiales bacterium UBA8960]
MKSLFLSSNIEITDQQLKQFELFYDLLIMENEKYNLTAITEKQDVYVKHFIDSILVNNLNFDF